MWHEKPAFKLGTFVLYLLVYLNDAELSIKYSMLETDGIDGIDPRCVQHRGSNYV
jgi:hypothetical protein